jgi:hypothetical protein
MLFLTTSNTLVPLLESLVVCTRAPICVREVDREDSDLDLELTLGSQGRLLPFFGAWVFYLVFFT